jgi:hypothetical protein
MGSDGGRSKKADCLHVRGCKVTITYPPIDDFVHGVFPVFLLHTPANESLVRDRQRWEAILHYALL